MEICYVPKVFSAAHLQVIEEARDICALYQSTYGLDLTLRQLYYQFVSRGLIPNRDTEYKRLGSIINDARMAGLLDWDYIVDRTRSLRDLGFNDSPREAIEHAAQAFRLDLWADQHYRPEVWIEKDALAGVIERVCQINRVPFFSCRGYTSQSEMWGAGMRQREYIENDQEPYIHLGDHDPSGIDMTSDIQERLSLFAEEEITVDRIALNMSQVRQYNPPPNPAKLTDSRGTGYVSLFGNQSWELDALNPNVLEALIQDAIDGLRDAGDWSDSKRTETDQRELITEIGERFNDLDEHWTEVVELLDA